MDYYLKPTGNDAQRQYLDYLIKRLTDWRQAGRKSFGQKFHGAQTTEITRKILQGQLGGSVYEPEKFEDNCAFIKSKIDATILGRRNAARHVRSYHSFTEHGVEKKNLVTKVKSFPPVAEDEHLTPALSPLGRGEGEDISGAAAETATPRDAIRRMGASTPAPESLNGDAVERVPTLSERQLREANERRLLLLSARRLLEEGVSVAAAAAACGVTNSQLHRLLILATTHGEERIGAAEKCRRLLALPVERLAPEVSPGHGSPFAALLQVPEIVSEMHRLYAATMGASCAQATNDRRTGSMATTLLRLGDFPVVPPHLAEKLRGGAQPKCLMAALKKAWTPEMEAKFRGQKHYNASTICGRRELVEEFADGSQAPLQPGRVWVFDDMSSNVPFWFECDNSSQRLDATSGLCRAQAQGDRLAQRAESRRRDARQNQITSTINRPGAAACTRPDTKPPMKKLHQRAAGILPAGLTFLLLTLGCGLWTLDCSASTFLATNDLGSAVSLAFYATNSAGQTTFGGGTNIAAGASNTITAGGTWLGVAVSATNATGVARADSYASLANTNGANCSCLITNGTLIYYTQNTTSTPGGGISGGTSYTNTPGGAVPQTNAFPANTNPPSGALNIFSSGTFFYGTNAPNGLLTAPFASIYNQFDSSWTNFVSQYVKTTTTGSNGWVMEMSNWYTAKAALTNNGPTAIIVTNGGVTTIVASDSLTTSLFQTLDGIFQMESTGLSNAFYFNANNSMGAFFFGDAGLGTKNGHLFAADYTGSGALLTGVNANTATTAMTAKMFPVMRIIPIGDSLSGTNTYSQNNSIWGIMVTNYGYVVVTNFSVPGIASGVIVDTVLEKSAPFFYLGSGQRTEGILWGGKNDEWGMGLNQSNTIYAEVTNQLWIGCQKIWALGGDVVLMTVPHSSGVLYTNLLGSEPATTMINGWILSLTNSPNLGGNLVVVDDASLYPQSSYTNANGTANTNTSVDGIHFTLPAMINIAALVAQTISNSPAWLQSYPSINPNASQNQGPPVILPNWSGFNNGNSDSGGNTYVNLGALTQPAYYECSGYDAASAISILGGAWISGQDQSTGMGGFTWGFRFLNKARTCSFLIDTSDKCGIFVGATNGDVAYNAWTVSSLAISALRGFQDLYPINSPLVLYMVPTNHILVVNANGTLTVLATNNSTQSGILTFDGNTLAITNGSGGTSSMSGSTGFTGGTLTATNVNASKLSVTGPFSVTNNAVIWSWNTNGQLMNTNTVTGNWGLWNTNDVITLNGQLVLTNAAQAQYPLTNAASLNVSFSHGLGHTPICRAVLLCTANDTSSGLTVGQEIGIESFVLYATSQTIFSVTANSTTIYLSFTGTGGSGVVVSLAGAGKNLSSFSNFSLKVYYQ